MAPRASVVGLVCVSSLLLWSAPAGAANFFRSASSNQNGAGSTSLAINKPAGVVAGDVMIAAVGANGNTAITAPAGWSSVGLYDAAAWTNTGWIQVAFKVAGASEPASYSWALGTTRPGAGTIVDYIGVDNAAPIQTSAVGTGTTSPAVAPTITTTSANQMVIANVGGRNTTGAFTFTNPAGTTDRVEVYSSTGAPRAGIDSADFRQAAAGATPTRSFTIAPTSTAWAGITVGLKPNT